MFVVRDVHRQLMHDWRMKMTSEAAKHPNLMNCFTKPRYYCALFTVVSLVVLIVFSFSHSPEKTVNQNLPKEVFEAREPLHRDSPFVPAPPNPLEPDVALQNNKIAVNPSNPTVPIPPPIPAPNPTLIPVPRDPQLIAIPQIQLVPKYNGFQANLLSPQRTTVPESQLAATPNIVDAAGIPPPQIGFPQVVPPPQAAQSENTSSTKVLVNDQKEINPVLDDDKVWKYMFNIWKQAALAQANRNPAPIP